VPVYLYRWRLGGLLGTRFLLLTHIGRRTGLRRQTVLEVLQYSKDGPQAVVMSGFGRDSEWARNIEGKQYAEVTVGSQHFVAFHRFLDEQETVEVLRDYEKRNRLLSPVVRRVLNCIEAIGHSGTPSLAIIGFRSRLKPINL